MTTTNDSSLASWAKAHLGTLYNITPAPSSTTGPALRDPFDAFIAQHAQIIINHEPTTRDELFESIQSGAIAAVGSDIEWKDLMEIPKDETNQAGIVTGIVVITRSLRFRIRAGPMQTKMSVVFSAKIDTDPAVKEGDPRRVVQLFQTVVNQPVPIHLHGVPSNVP